ncbi:MAG: hypothetical protein MI924_26360, partial [Chloroflexales bacterium]|nr:hypothetical protein [Chloroflexales bacterium]
TLKALAVDAYHLGAFGVGHGLDALHAFEVEAHHWDQNATGAPRQAHRSGWMWVQPTFDALLLVSATPSPKRAVKDRFAGTGSPRGESTQQCASG